jgi:Zn ribbon nucleic-acid-binding protein
MSLISNCPLCEEHGLHVFGEEEAQIMQCISCGYVSSTKFLGKKENNSEYQKLSDDMKKWAVEENNRIWIPTIITLPDGMLYPENDEDGKMTWKLASMVEISDKEKEHYPNPEGGYFTKRIDTENAKVHEKFIDGMTQINELLKQRASSGE